METLSKNLFSAKHPLWALGFRPFFLFGSLHAVFIVAIWASQFSSWPLLSLPGNSVDWHAHEMIFGFASAIVAGFLLTATQNWSNIRGVHGRALQALITIWILPRIIIFIPFSSIQWLATLLNLIFFPTLLFLLRPYILIKTQKRNWIFFFLLASLLIGQLLFHLDQLQLTSDTAPIGIYLGVFIILTMITIIGGRVIPFFTVNAIPSANVATRKWIDNISIGSTFAIGFCYLAINSPSIVSWVCFIGALIHAARWLTWDFVSALQKPILSILYIGYAWMIIGFFLIGLSTTLELPKSPALHALTTGSMGVTILAMISRVALGHTGRKINASRSMIIAYIALNVGALIRVFGPLFDVSFYQISLLISGLLWSVAFALFCIQYTPILLSSRLDNKPG